MPTVYPCVPGHEIVGRVTRVGSAVTGFKPGDLASVGCMVDSDRTCPESPRLNERNSLMGSSSMCTVGFPRSLQSGNPLRSACAAR